MVAVAPSIVQDIATIVPTPFTTTGGSSGQAKHAASLGLPHQFLLDSVPSDYLSPSSDSHADSPSCLQPAIALLVPCLPRVHLVHAYQEHVETCRNGRWEAQKSITSVWLPLPRCKPAGYLARHRAPVHSSRKLINERFSPVDSSQLVLNLAQMRMQASILVTITIMHP